MRILIFHGYLLGGTGSNVYNARLAAALVRAGHEVHLLCQDREPFAQGWVDAAGDWDGGSLTLETRREPARATVYRPDLGGLLPVYVADRYDGIEAKPFPELSEDELARYLERNVAAVREVAELARPDVALANHLVMGPVVLARALDGVPYAVKVHGSALEYTVKPHPDRFLAYAREGLAPAKAVLVGSRHTAESLWAAMDDPGLEARTKLGPPGVDIEEFRPREPEAARSGLDDLVRRLEAAGGGPERAAGGPKAAGGGPAAAPGGPKVAGGSSEAASGRPAGAAADAPAAAPGSSFARDEAAAARALSTIDPGDRLVVFVGKLIASKGVDLLLAAWPLVLRRVPEAKLVIVGFGAFREDLERLAGDLASGREMRGENGLELKYLRAFLDDPPPDYPARADRIVWAGRLDHAELADLLPATEAMVVPSTFPEAFGMVAAEAAACGSLPVVALHSGLGEVAGTLSEAVPAAARPLLGFERGPGAVAALAAALAGWLDAPDALRAQTREAMVAITRERYSWEGVAGTMLAAAEGRLEGLPAP